MTTIKDLIMYLHRACFSPTISTWVQAIDAGYFVTWPGLTSKLVKKYLPKSIATAKGHMRQTRQNLRSTRTSKTLSNDTTVEMTASPPPSEDDARTNCAYLTLVTITGKVATDQTGRFPQTSSLGNKYVMVLFVQDANAILAEPITDRSDHELLRATQHLHDRITAVGLHPTYHVLDNECSKGMKKYLDSNDTIFQLVPPNYHRTNPAERAIATFKDHLIAGLSSTDPNFPLHLWDRIIPQAEKTLTCYAPPH